MDVEMKDAEFDLNDVVDDVQMSDDELEKELKELEKENELKSRDEENPQKNNETSISEPVDSKKKVNHKKRHGKDKVSLKTFYDELESGGKYQDHHEETHNKRHIERSDIYRERNIDYKRLNRSLHISKNCDPMIVGREIAYRLHEPKTILFGHVVRVLGQNMVSEIFAETKELVNRGGIKTDSGDRVRSPGGTFLYIMKNRCYATSEQVKEIFKEDNEARKQQKKKLKRQNFVHRGVEENVESQNVSHKGMSSDGQGKCVEGGKYSSKGASVTTTCSEVKSELTKDPSKDVTTCSGLEVTSESCVLGNLGDKGMKTNELRNDIPVEENTEIKIGEDDDGDKSTENTKSNVNTEELEEGEIVCNGEEETTELAT